MQEEILKKLEKNIAIFSLRPITNRTSGVCSKIECQYQWSRTDGAKLIRLVLEPIYTSSGSTHDLVCLYPNLSPRAILCDMPQTAVGLYKITPWLVLDNDEVRMLEKYQTTVMVGKIIPPAYRTRRIKGGWTQIHLIRLGDQIYRNLLYLAYDGHTYPYPQECGIPAGECYVPSKSKIVLKACEKMLPQPDDQS